MRARNYLRELAKLHPNHIGTMCLLLKAQVDEGYGNSYKHYPKPKRKKRKKITERGARDLHYCSLA